MRLQRSAIFLFATLVSLVSCSGGSHSLPPASQPPASIDSGISHTYALTSRGTGGKVTLRATTALPETAVTMDSAWTCPTIPPIKILNPFPFPIMINIDTFTVMLPCSVSGKLFGATFYQIKPQAQMVSPTKLGDVMASGQTITFTSTVGNITLQPGITYQITILPEASTAEVAFPVAPGSTTNLTANATNVPSGLNFTYATASGGTTYSAACFNAFTDGQLAPALQNVPLVGIPSFFCQITPANNAVLKFGQTVNFSIVQGKADRGVLIPDGIAQGFLCTLGDSCNLPGFSVPTTYQTFIASNVLDLAACVPATANTDCNNVPGLPQGGSRAVVPAGQQFQFFVADDPTYKPTAHWSGLLQVAAGPAGVCHVDTGPDDNNGDAPPGYSDDAQNGIGPDTEFDIDADGPGTCNLSATEDAKYITDYANPANPTPRSITIQVKVQSVVPQ